MRVAVRKRMGVRMKMRTQPVKRAWWTRTQMQRRRVKWRSVCSHGHGGALAGISSNELCSGGGRAHRAPGLLQCSFSAAAPQQWGSRQLLCPVHVL